MRLDTIVTMEAANAFLPCFLTRFNARFAVTVADAEPVWVALPDDADRTRLFSVQEMRTVRADQTLSFLGKTLLLEGKRSFAGQRVAVHLTPEGELCLYAGDKSDKFRQPLSYKVMPDKQKQQAKQHEPQPTKKQSTDTPQTADQRADQTDEQTEATVASPKRTLSPGQAAWL